MHNPFDYVIAIRAVCLLWAVALFGGCDRDKDDEEAKDTRETGLPSEECSVPKGYRSLCDADATFIGESDENYLGRIIAGTGDINGDGFTDLVIGPWFDALYGPISSGEHILEGKPVITGMICSSMDAGGDANGDGISDVLCGEMEINQATLFTGSVNGLPGDLADPGVWLFQGRDGYPFGDSVALSGDYDADGLDDVLVGGGGVYLFSSPFEAKTSDKKAATASWSGTDEVMNIGELIGSPGDVNGDGVDDIAITNRSKLFMYFSPVKGSYSIDDADIKIVSDPYRIRAMGQTSDLDGDGLDDLLLGSDDYKGIGGVFLFTEMASKCPNTMEDATAVLIGDVTTEYTGNSITVVAQSDSGEVTNLLVGAFGEAHGVVLAVPTPIEGVSTISEVPIKFASEPDGWNAGWSTAAGDLDHDGSQDFVIGDPGYCRYRSCDGKGHFAPEGKAYMVFGKSL